MFESVYHGVPLVTMPVFCDHDVNAAKAEVDGYALKLELQTLTADKLSKHYCHRLLFFSASLKQKKTKKKKKKIKCTCN